MAFAQAKTLCLSSGSAEGTAKLLYSGDMDTLFAETHKDLGKYGQEIIAQHTTRTSKQKAAAAARGDKRGAAAASGAGGKGKKPAPQAPEAEEENSLAPEAP